MTQTIEKNHVKAALTGIKAYAEAIKELKEVPSGELYAQVMPLGVTLDTHNTLLEILKKAKLISIDGMHLIKWIA